MNTRTLIIWTAAAILSAASISSAVTYWGTEGVMDTSRVRNIVQITDDSQTDQLKMLGGRSWPQGTVSTVDPWSKDGQWIAFTAEIDGSGENYEEICKIRSNGSDFTRLTANAVSDSNASFGPDGKVYYSHYSGAPNYRYEVWRIEATGSNATNLSAAHFATASEYNPRISPDGAKIAYVKSNILWVANADGTAETKVSGKRSDGTTDIAADQYNGFSWSPNSRFLAYTGNDGIGDWIYVVRSDGSDAGSYVPSITRPPFFFGTLYHEWPEFSPDGTRIAFLWRQYTGAPDYYYHYNLRMVAAGGGSQVSLDSASTDPLYGIEWEELGGPFSWSPDGRWVVYRKKYNADPGNYHNLFMVDTTRPSPAPVQLTTDYGDYIPVWSPNGKQILFQSGGGDSPIYPTREDPANGDTGDLLLLNMNVGFPWPMFLPAIENSSQK